MRAVLINNIASPYQVKFCESLQEYMDITFLFCMELNNQEQAHWHAELPNCCVALSPQKRFIIRHNTFYRYANFDVFGELSRINPEIVVIGGVTQPTSYFAYLWCKRNKRKVVIFSEISKRPYLLPLYRRLYSGVDAILAVGKDAQEQWREYFKCKVYNFTYAADIEEKLLIKKHRSAGDVVRFLYASRYVEEHNPLLLIEAFSDLVKEANVHLTMSSRGPLESACISKAKELNIPDDRIEFRNNLHSWGEVNSLFQENDILVFPGKSTWGLVIPEAMAAEMPVITTKDVKASELLPLKESFINPDRKALYLAMKRFTDNNELIQYEGRINRENVVSQTYKSKSKVLLEIFQEVLGVFQDE